MLLYYLVILRTEDEEEEDKDRITPYNLFLQEHIIYYILLLQLIEEVLNNLKH